MNTASNDPICTDDETPDFMLSGELLDEIGFHIGTVLEVEVSDGCIRITLARNTSASTRH